MVEPQCCEAPGSLYDGPGLFSFRDLPPNGLVIGTKRELTRCGSHLEPLDNRRYVNVRRQRGDKAGASIEDGRPTEAAVVECEFPLENRIGWHMCLAGMEIGRSWRFAFLVAYASTGSLLPLEVGIREWLMGSSG